MQCLPGFAPSQALFLATRFAPTAYPGPREQAKDKEEPASPRVLLSIEATMFCSPKKAVNLKVG